MRAAFICCIAASLAAVCARAQEWEVGGAGGFGAYKNATVTSPTGSATVGFDNRFAHGFPVAENTRTRKPTRCSFAGSPPLRTSRRSPEK